jgi:hypothetical protein
MRNLLEEAKLAAWGAETRLSRCGEVVFVDESADYVAAADM